MSILWEHTFEGLENLITLDMSNNLLKYWGANVFVNLSSLENLHLEGNLLQTFIPEMLPHGLLESLNTIDISDNPFSCICRDIRWLLQMHRRIKKNLINPNNILCETPSSLRRKRLFDPKIKSDICPAESLSAAYIALLVLSGVLSIVAMVTSIVYRFKWHVRYFMFKIKSSFTKYELVCDVKDYTYDAFVSYNRNDTTWLTQTFLPIAEEEFGYKLCLHDRD